MNRKVLTLAIGAKLTPKPETIDHFVSEARRKITGRIGVVTGHSYPNRAPIVVFPAVGRKKEYRIPGHAQISNLKPYFDIEGEFIEMDVAQ